MTALAAADTMFAEQQSAAPAAAAQAAGGVREAAIRRNYDRTQSEVHAAIGKSGVDTTGSPLLVLIQNADTVGQELALNNYQTALDVKGAEAGAVGAGLTRMEGNLRAQSLGLEARYARYGGAVAASDAAGQAAMLGMQGGAVRSAGMFNVGSTLLGGASNAALAYARHGRATDTPRQPSGYSSGRPAWG